eukprot:TRINITY_DN42374_c0_g1_i1.p2 TRINITY_DN42374_c0_g1~~TRINITY_DN42374_c0_g1_i1.p2  ORF type:complete len:103 (+),score=22.94 TRINITY_DN42374_c0_g1_i1:2-310(+)
MIRRPPKSTLSSSSAASDVYKRQYKEYAKGPSPLLEASTFSLQDLMPARENPLASEDTDDETESVNLAASLRNGASNSGVVNSVLALGSTCLLYTSPSPRDS